MSLCRKAKADVLSLSLTLFNHFVQLLWQFPRRQRIGNRTNAPNQFFPFFPFSLLIAAFAFGLPFLLFIFPHFLSNTFSSALCTTAAVHPATVQMRFSDDSCFMTRIVSLLWFQRRSYNDGCKVLISIQTVLVFNIRSRILKKSKHTVYIHKTE